MKTGKRSAPNPCGYAGNDCSFPIVQMAFICK